MVFEIDPEPSEEEREAIVAALETAETPDGHDLWWRTGVRENLEEGAGESLSPAGE